MVKKFGLLVFPVLMLIIIRFVLHFNGLYGQDAYEYLRYTNRLKDFFQNGIGPGDYFWPIGFPFVGSIFSFLVRDSSFALQLISTLSLCGILFFAEKILDLFHPNSTGKKSFLFLFLCLCPFLLRGSIICMSDLGATFFVTAFYFCFCAFSQNEKPKFLLGMFFFGANAIMFRYASAILFILPAFLLVKKVATRKHLFFLFGGVIVFAICILPHYLFRSEHPFSFLRHEWLSDWSFRNYFQTTFITSDGTSNNFFPNVIYVFISLFHPGFFGFGICLIYFVWKQRPLNRDTKIMLGAVLIYLLFLAGIPIQNLRFFLLPLPIFVVAFYPGFVLLTEIINVNFRRAIFVFIALIQSSLFVYCFKPFYVRNKLENEIKDWLVTNTKEKVIYSFDIDVTLKSGGLDRIFYNLWERKYDSFEKNSLILFNVPAFEQQWKGKNPMLNWENVNKQANLKLVKSFPQNWNLYEIK